MKSMKSTKRALIFSVISLLVCFTMLIGTTYAWFTDSATSSGNKITTGTLDVNLLLWDGNEYVDISENEDPIFGEAGLAQDSLNTLWEPGKTQVAYLAIENKGSLDLQYKVNLAVTSYTKNLYEAMEYAIVPNVSNGTGVTEWTDGVAVVPGNNKTQAENVALAAGVTHYFALVVHMNEEAGNEYQDAEINFDIKVLAAQLASESDAFDNQYDVNATFPDYGSASAVVDGSASRYDLTVYDTQVAGDNNKQKIGYAYISEDAIDPDAENVSVTINKAEKVDSSVTITADQTAMTYDVSVTNIKENNDTPITVAIRIGEGYTGLKFYHKGDEIPEAPAKNDDGEFFVYSGEYIEFVTKNFSPFTVVYDKTAMVLPPVEDVLPVAEVEYVTLTEDIVWEDDFGSYYPSSSTQQLDAVYSFKAPAGEVGMYEDWLCDYYVKFETTNKDLKKLPEGAITLGGNYGTWGWIGFDNPEVDTNTFIPLLGSVTGGDYWTYENVRAFVSEFMCGVAIADNTEEANKAAGIFDGAKFVVELRLTNPVDNESIAVNTVIYDFANGNSTIDGKTVVTTAQGIQDAVNNGDGNIVMGGDIDLSQGIVIPGN